MFEIEDLNPDHQVQDHPWKREIEKKSKIGFRESICEQHR